MSDTQVSEMSKWARKVAGRYNKSITYVLMKIHKSMNIYDDMEIVKISVIEALW